VRVPKPGRRSICRQGNSELNGISRLHSLKDFECNSGNNSQCLFGPGTGILRRAYSVAWDVKLLPDLGYVLFLSGERTCRVPALASNFHVARPCIFTNLAAIFFAARNSATTRNVCTSVLLKISHQSLRSFSRRLKRVSTAQIYHAR
jgi:hypothetical protein